MGMYGQAQVAQVVKGRFSQWIAFQNKHSKTIRVSLLEALLIIRITKTIPLVDAFILYIVI